MAFVLKKAIDSIYCAEFNSYFDMTDTMMRLQAFYELPEFRGKVFTVDEFKSWYTKKCGGWTYHNDWGGYNVPSTILDSFLKENFFPLSERELNLFDAICSLPRPFYLIVTHTHSHSQILRHELAHGLYFTNSDYRAEIYSCLSDCQLAPLHRYLMPDYHSAVWLDEAHAHLLANYDYLCENKIIAPGGALLEASLAMASSFDCYTYGKFKEPVK